MLCFAPHLHGLGLTFEHELTNVEHRFCLFHFHANLKGAGYKGKAFKDALWAAGTSTNLVDFKTTMFSIEVSYPDAHEKLLEIETSLWLRF